jgi:O-antigen ligase
MKKLLLNFSRLEIIIVSVLTVIWVFDRPLSLITFLLLPLIWIGAFYRTGHFFPPTLLDLPLVLIISLTLFSLMITPDLAASSGKVLGVVLGISLYYALTRFRKEDTPFPRFSISDPLYRLYFMVLFTLIGASVALLGLLGADWFEKYELLASVTNRLPHMFPSLPGLDTGFQPNAISGTLVLFTPLTFYFGYQSVVRLDKTIVQHLTSLQVLLLRIVIIGSIFIQFCWWILAQTRGAWLGVFSGLIFMAILMMKPQWKTAAWILPITIVVIVFFYWFSTTGSLTIDIELARLSGANLSETLQYRFQVWKWAIQVIDDFPFTGVGYNIFRELAPLLYFGPWLGDVAHAHNIWLDIGVSLGIGGIIVWLILWIINIKSLWKVYSMNSNRWKGFTALGLLAGWYSYFIFGLADTIPLGSKLGMGLFFVLGVGHLFISSEILEKTSGR